MQLQDYVMEKETLKQVCPNCSKHDEDYATYVDRYGNSWDENSEGCYCQSCGFCFEAA